MNPLNLNTPVGLASSITGLPAKASPVKSGKKKPTHRGRKPSGKPGAQHLSALQAAHGAGNFAQAKTHALNYAKAVHTATAGGAASSSATPSDTDSESYGPGYVDDDTDDTPAVAAPAKQTAPNPRAALAKIAMSRMKK